MTAFKYRMIVQYDGTDYHGWQYQKDNRTIQGTIEEGLRQILRRNIRLVGASRTDMGVHADYQVAHFLFPESLEVNRVRRALNAVLPWDIRIRDLERVSHKFHARFGADWKEYVYRIHTGDYVPPSLYRYVWHVPVSLDFAAMETAARDLVGMHDYASLGKGVMEGTTTLRTVLWARWEHRPPLYLFRIASRGFLRGMVRYITGILFEIGLRRRPVDTIRKILEDHPPDAIHIKSPARGLCLNYVSYPEDLVRIQPFTKRGYISLAHTTNPGAL